MKGLSVALGLGALGVGSGAYYAYRQAFYARGSKKNIKGYFEKNVSFQKAKDEVERMITELDACPYEEVYVKAHDGIRLFAKYFHTKDGVPIQILVHGYKGKANRDMCGAFKLARQLGHNVLLIDMRGCGKSQGDTVSFGVLERHDLLTWINYLTKRFGGVPIFLLGISMGGATALMATDMNLPGNVKGVIADCPYTSPEDIVKKVCADRGMPKHIFPIVALGARLYGKFDITSQSAIRSVAKSKVPILILHGKKDGFIPYEMAQRIYDAAKCEKTIVFFDEADHGAAYMSDPPKYEAAVGEFVKSCLDNSSENQN